MRRTRRARGWPRTWPGIFPTARARWTPARWTRSWTDYLTAHQAHQGRPPDGPAPAVKEERDDEDRILAGGNHGRDRRDDRHRLRRRRAGAQRGAEGSRRAEAEARRDADGAG